MVAVIEKDFVCQFDPEWKSQCQLDLTKIGDVNVVSELDFCSQPPLLNIVLKIQRHAWKMSFLQGNSRESRIIGLEYFPLRLHVDFQKMSPMTYHVECCLEALKTSGTYCYLNSTIVHSDSTDFCTEDSQTGSGSLVVFCLLILVSLFTLLTALIVGYKRVKRLKTLSKQRRPYIIPKLPRAKGYDVFEEDLKKTNNETVPIVISTIPEETSEELRNDSKNNWRESKFVQTSCNSLDTEILILSSNSSQNSSSSPVEGGGRNSREALAESPL